MMRAFILAIVMLLPGLTVGAGPSPPAELLQLEREVSLKMAHARDEGFTDPSKSKTLSEAETIDAQAEKALKDGEYQSAEDGFLKTRVLLHSLGI